MGFVSELRSNWTVIQGLRRLNKYVSDLDAESPHIVPDDIERTVAAVKAAM